MRRVVSDDPDEVNDLPRYGLVMPFVSVTSHGGPHDDASYSAGWEMGALDALLEHQKPGIHALTIRDTNIEQADLIAMQHGYQATVETTGVEGWLRFKLTKTQSVP
jgi:hypothetical protein